jgi:addiction module HigA family antidote
MEPAGITAYALAKDLHVPLPTVNDIVRETRAISPEMALLLSTYFSTSDGYWINLQCLNRTSATPDAPTAASNPARLAKMI